MLSEITPLEISEILGVFVTGAAQFFEELGVLEFRGICEAKKEQRLVSFADNRRLMKHS